MTTKLVPLGNRVLLRRIESSTWNGIEIPRSSEIDEGTQEYEVMTVPQCCERDVDSDGNCDRHSSPGTSRLHNKPYPRRGDRIYLARHKGWKIETNDGEELYVAEVDDILAVEVDA